MNNYFTTILITLFIITLNGCISFFTVNSRYSDVEEEFESLTNKVTKNDIYRLYGKPYNKTYTEDGEEWHYWYYKNSEDDYVMSSRDEIYKYEYYDYLTLIFDSSDTLRYWQYIMNNVELK